MLNLCAIILVSFLLCILGGSANDISSRSAIYRLRRQTDCDGFQCKTSGECLNEDKFCDGHVDCVDGSDETNRCLQLSCPGFVFRCKYGACINRWLECDGKKDCKDGSDETSSKCKNPPKSTKCKNTQFECKSGQCISEDNKCDGIADCTDQSDETSSKCKNPPKSTKCKNTQFECKSGQCISEDNKCDGIADCTDQSDETSETCSKIRCPKYTFKCDYGACVSGTGLCDGNKDCLDGSDENPQRCDNPNPTVSSIKPPIITPTPTPPSTGGERPPPVTSPGSCVLPAQVNKGSWSVWMSTYDYRPGDRVASGTILRFQCDKGYKIEGPNALLFCVEGNFNAQIPTCIQTCPPLNPMEPTFAKCQFKGVEVNCSEAVSRTTAKYSCGPFHELSTKHDILYCFDGAWDKTKPTCVPVCGEKNVKIKELIIGGEVVKRGTYPWTIALYKLKTDGFTHICGGSLISQRVIVTAAHCVTRKDGEKLPVNIYRVAAGKYYNLYNDSRDTDAEFSEVEKIFVPERYKGSEQRFASDIAVLVTKEAFNATQFIQRICVDWDQNSYYENRLLGTNGTVTGWGYTVRGKAPSEVLKEISLPYVTYQQCYSAMPDEYKQYVVEDKICAGYLNKGIGVCEGDSGGGLAFPLTENNRFYLRGIVSVAPQISGSCNEDEYALYTKVSVYIDFLADIVRKY